MEAAQDECIWVNIFTICVYILTAHIELACSHHCERNVSHEIMSVLERLNMSVIHLPIGNVWWCDASAGQYTRGWWRIVKLVNIQRILGNFCFLVSNYHEIRGFEGVIPHHFIIDWCIGNGLAARAVEQIVSMFQNTQYHACGVNICCPLSPIVCQWMS